MTDTPRPKSRQRLPSSRNISSQAFRTSAASTETPVSRRAQRGPPQQRPDKQSTAYIFSCRISTTSSAISKAKYWLASLTSKLIAASLTLCSRLMRCSHKYTQLPLIPADEFIAQHPEHANDDENELMIARIDHERKEREALEQQRQELLKRKQKLIAENKRRKDDLANLDKELEKFIDVCFPSRSLLLRISTDAVSREASPSCSSLRRHHEGTAPTDTPQLVMAYPTQYDSRRFVRVRQ